MGEAGERVVLERDVSDGHVEVLVLAIQRGRNISDRPDWSPLLVDE